MSFRIYECPLCRGDKFVRLLEARDFHYGNPGKYTLVKCVGCSLCFQNPMYSESELSAFYPSDYYSFVDRFSLDQNNSFRGRLRSIVLGPDIHCTKDPKFERPGRMLDVGCGSGWFMAKMREQGWDVKGVEPSAAAARLGRSEKGLDIFAGSLLAASFPSKSFDYVRFNHSFEHMANPNEILDEAHRILADNGKLMIGVPNRASLNARIFGPYWWHLALPVHTFAYSTQPLSKLLSDHEFRVEKVVFNTERNAIIGSIRIYLNRNDLGPSTEGRFASGRLGMMFCSWAARLQNALRIADVIEITATKQSRARRQ